MKRFFAYFFISFFILILLLAGFIINGIVFQKTTFVNEQLVFTNRLSIPPLLAPRMENGEKVFDLTAQIGKKEFFQGKTTQTMGLNGNYLGPTVRVHTGENVRINVTNSLSELLTLHWHGMHLPAVMDGGPHQAIKQKTTWTPYWKITNEAATLWYHPHLMGKTAEEVYRGLAGMFIIDDANSDALALPVEYGIDDIPLIVQDRKFDSNGQFVYDHNHSFPITAGMLADTIVVNGTVGPYLEVPAKMVRLRILNGSNARRYNFGFSDNRTFYQIGTDGGLLASPVATTRILLASGERAEILVDLHTAKKPVTLMSYAVPNDENRVRGFILRTITRKTDEFEQFKILELRPQSGNFAKEEIPQRLNTISHLKESNAVKTRQFSLDSTTINGKAMDHMRVDEVVKKGDIEIWNVVNNSPMYHGFHVHGVQFFVLDRNSKPPASTEAGWKDTVMLNPGEKVRLIMQFTDYADPNFPYMFHCHILEHEDMGMMGQFVVVDNPSEKIKIHSPLEMSGDHKM